jgi:hypothetical protein
MKVYALLPLDKAGAALYLGRHLGMLQPKETLSAATLTLTGSDPGMLKKMDPPALVLTQTDPIDAGSRTIEDVTFLEGRRLLARANTLGKLSDPVLSDAVRIFIGSFVRVCFLGQDNRSIKGEVAKVRMSAYSRKQSLVTIRPCVRL